MTERKWNYVHVQKDVVSSLDLAGFQGFEATLTQA